MNANQIADELENIYWVQGDGKGKPFQQYADFVRQQQAEIEALQSALSGNKEVMADWEAELKDVRELNTVCWRSQRQLKAENEALKAELHKYKPQIWEVMKEANK